MIMKPGLGDRFFYAESGGWALARILVILQGPPFSCSQSALPCLLRCGIKEIPAGRAVATDGNDVISEPCP